MSGQCLVGPVKYPRGNKRCRNSGNLDHPAFRFPAHRIGGDDTESRDLCDRKIDKDDAASQYLGTQRHVRAQHQDARQERGQNDAQLKCVQFAYSSSMRRFHHKA